MSVVTLIIYLAVIGVVLYLVNKFIPMDGKFKQLINVIAIIVAVILVIFWILGIAGVETGIHIK